MIHFYRLYDKNCVTPYIQMNEQYLKDDMMPQY